MTVTFGIVGVGGRDKTSFHDMKRLDWLRAQAVCDLDKERMNAWADDVGVPERYTQYEDLLAGDVDFVYVATPPPMHAKMAIQALEAGKHVLSELPAVHTIEEGRDLVEAVEKSGKLYMLGENYAFRRDVQAFTRFIQNGELGRIVYARGSYCHDLRHYLAEWKRTNMRTWFLTYEWPRYVTHALGPLLYATGDSVAAISAIAADGRIHIEEGKPQITSAHCRMESGALFHLFYGHGLDRHEVCYSFTGKAGTIESLPLAVSPVESNPPLLGDKPYRLTRMRESGDLYNGRMIDIDPGHPFNSYRGGSHWESDLCILAVFAECIRDDKPSPIDVHRGLDMTLPGICAIESIRKDGAWVDVPAL